MATLWQTCKLIKQWNFNRLNTKEKRFINEIINFAGDGSDDPSDETLMADGEVTKPMAAWIRSIGKRFLITKATKL